MGPICFKESSFPKEFEPMCWETMFYVSMGNLAYLLHVYRDLRETQAHCLKELRCGPICLKQKCFQRGFERICPKESHILTELEPICLWEVASLFPPREWGKLN
jgi:hypothetical protein